MLDCADVAGANRHVLDKLTELYLEAFRYDGFAEIRMEMRILRRGRKEVILHCGKQYRFPDCEGGGSCLKVLQIALPAGAGMRGASRARSASGKKCISATKDEELDNIRETRSAFQPSKPAGLQSPGGFGGVAAQRPRHLSRNRHRDREVGTLNADEAS